MCGRFRCSLTWAQAAEAAGVPIARSRDAHEYSPVENAGPGRFGAVVKKGERGVCLQAMRWGLVPGFYKRDTQPDHFAMFNARSETLHERPAFRRLVQSGRCVVLADGYYEWEKVGKKEKQPHYCYRTRGPLKFAGLYDVWSTGQEDMHTFTIITAEAPTKLQWLHNRVPVVLRDDEADKWLSDAKFDDVKALLAPYTGDDLAWHPVDKRVGSMKYQGEDCAKKVDIRHGADISWFFQNVKEEDASVGQKRPSEDPPLRPSRKKARGKSHDQQTLETFFSKK